MKKLILFTIISAIAMAQIVNNPPPFFQGQHNLDFSCGENQRLYNCPCFTPDKIEYSVIEEGNGEYTIKARFWTNNKSCVQSIQPTKISSTPSQLHNDATTLIINNITNEYNNNNRFETQTLSIATGFLI